jgi:hypothetical protein
MRSVARLIGGLFFAIWFVASAVLFFFYWEVLTHWFGRILGTVIAACAAPGSLFFHSYTGSSKEPFRPSTLNF